MVTLHHGGKASSSDGGPNYQDPGDADEQPNEGHIDHGGSRHGVRHVPGVRSCVASAYHSRRREGFTCQDLSNDYGARPGDLAFLPPALQPIWTYSFCSTWPTSGDLCQVASDRYGIDANVS